MRGETYVASVGGKNEPSAYAEMPNEPTRATWRVILKMVDVEDGDEEEEVDAWRCCLESLRAVDVDCDRKEDERADD